MKGQAEGLGFEKTRPEPKHRPRTHLCAHIPTIQHYTLRWAIPSKPADNCIIIEGEGSEQYQMVLPFKGTRCRTWQMSHHTRAHARHSAAPTHPAEAMILGLLSHAHRSVTCLLPRIDSATRVMLENG